MAVSYNAYLTTLPYGIKQATVGGTVFSANIANGTSFDIFPDDAVVDDALYFNIGWNGRQVTDSVKFNITTALVADAITVVWEYYAASDNAWRACTNVTDNTNAFRTSGVNTVDFDRLVDINQFPPDSASTYPLRCRITAVTNITEGGYQTSNVQMHDCQFTVAGYSAGTPCTASDIWDYDQAQGLGLVDKLSFNTYFFHVPVRVSGYFGDTLKTLIFGKTYLADSATYNYATPGMLAPTASGTITLGTYSGGYGYNGCTIIINMVPGGHDGYRYAWGSGSVYAYGSTLIALGTEVAWFIGLQSGRVDLIDSYVAGLFTFCKGTFNLNRFVLNRNSQGTGYVEVNNAAGTLQTYWIIQRAGGGIRAYEYSNSEFTDLKIVGYKGTNALTTGIYWGKTVNNIISNDGDDTPSNIQWGWYATSTGYYTLRYTLDLTVQDSNGTAISGAIVTIKDVNGARAEPHARLTATANAGQKVVTVNSTSLLTAGDTIKIEINSTEEDEKVISTVDSATQITLTANLTYAHYVGDLIHDVTNPNLTTNASGNVAVSYLSHARRYGTSSGWEYETPHTVQISKAGYITKTVKYTMDQKRIEVETLEKVRDLNFSKKGRLITQ